MAEQKAAAKVGRPSRSVDEEIQAVEQKLAALKQRKREIERVERERNQKAILALLRAEGLDDVPADKWQSSLPKLRELLLGGLVAKTPKVAKTAETQEAAASAPGAH